MQRYQVLVDLIRETKPRTIIEIGTHRGRSAQVMINEALRFHHTVQYRGFDVFESEDEAFHEEVLNGKGVAVEEEVRGVLDLIQRRHPRMSYELIRGRTQDTLHGKNLHADFVFIDGDHRLEAIRADYAAVKTSPVIVFDDCYPDPNNQPDLSVYGCNQLLEELKEHLPVRLYQKIDRTREGWPVGCAFIAVPFDLHGATDETD